MRNLFYIAALAMVGCYSEEKFSEDFATKYCDAIVECGGEPCVEGEEGGTTTAAGECDFDSAAAKECIDATWECSEEVAGVSFPIVPDVCLTVCGAADTTPTTE